MHRRTPNPLKFLAILIRKGFVSFVSSCNRFLLLIGQQCFQEKQLYNYCLIKFYIWYFSGRQAIEYSRNLQKKTFYCKTNTYVLFKDFKKYFVLINFIYKFFNTYIYIIEYIKIVIFTLVEWKVKFIKILLEWTTLT